MLKGMRGTQRPDRRSTRPCAQAKAPAWCHVRLPANVFLSASVERGGWRRVHVAPAVACIDLLRDESCERRIAGADIRRARRMSG